LLQKLSLVFFLVVTKFAKNKLSRRLNYNFVSAQTNVQADIQTDRQAFNITSVQAVTPDIFIWATTQCELFQYTEKVSLT